MRVFCIEGEWHSRITDRQSVEPLLAMLSTVEGVEYVHRRVGTRHELQRQIRNWRRHESYSVLYMASHGERGALYLSDDEGAVSLDDLTGMLDGACDNAFVMLSGCQTMLAGDKALRAFIEGTGAAALTGYRILVPWIPSAALDLLLLHSLNDDSRRARKQSGLALLRRFANANAELVHATGFDWYVREGRGLHLLADAQAGSAHRRKRRSVS